ncbi:MAG TPA: class E sortase [Acidimicrobiales bacterium]|nr:class E sortase [Acidimicrobiales bacterium]
MTLTLTEPVLVRQPRAVTPRWIALGVAIWLAVTLLAVVLVLYGVGPLIEQREQTSALSEYRAQIRHAAAEAEGLAGVEVPTQAPAAGTPVAIIDIGGIHLEQVVVEGVGPQQTRGGPGHVPGTAAPGQPGNSAIVARRTAFGGPFRRIGRLERGDRILVTTTQGQTVYVVTTVVSAPVADAPATAPVTTTTAPPDATVDGDAATDADAGATTATTVRPRTDTRFEIPEGGLTTEELYGPTPDDRLTLVTSASSWPWATSRATIVVARMSSRPFAPTPQGGRTGGDDGRGTDGGAAAPLVLALGAYLVAVGVAIVLYRWARPRSAYLLTAPPLAAAILLTAEAIARLFPAWM